MDKPRERPLLMRGPLVVASLEGRKTQTRRIVKPWPEFIGGQGQEADPACWGWSCPSGAWVVLDRTAPPYHGPDYSQSHESYAATCPHGAVGEQLWVREAWAVDSCHDKTAPRDLTRYGLRARDHVAYAAGPKPYNYLRDEDDEIGRWRPGIHMPRWACRLVLEITAVRVQRVQDITEEDAWAEGVEPWSHSPDQWDCAHTFRFGDAPHKAAFCVLWDEINGKRHGCSWVDNPWVWCISYRKVET